MGVAHQREEARVRDLKFEVTTGKVITVERVKNEHTGEWDNEIVNLTERCRMIADVRNTRVGFYSFIKGVGFHIWAETDINGQVERPDVNDHRVNEGMRLRVKLDCKPYSVLEIRATSDSMWTAMNDLVTLWQEREAEHPGLVPVVTIARWDTVPVRSGAIHVPVFEIVDWVKRPRDLPDLPPPRPRPPKTLVGEPKKPDNGGPPEEGPPPEDYDGPHEGDESLPV